MASDLPYYMYVCSKFRALCFLQDDMKMAWKYQYKHGDPWYSWFTHIPRIQTGILCLQTPSSQLSSSPSMLGIKPWTHDIFTLLRDLMTFRFVSMMVSDPWTATLGTSDINYYSVSRVEHSRRGYDSTGLSSVWTAKERQITWFATR
jgi:hypothetical protein